MKLKPCDCKDELDAKKLNEQGFAYNEDSINIEPNVVILKIRSTTVRIPMSRFKMFAEWYLTDQNVKP
jgi:hypothetical protein